MSETISVKKKNHAFLTITTDPGIMNEISDFFTFFVPGYKFMPAYKNKMWDGKIRLFDVRVGELPGGLFAYLQEFASTPGRDYHIEIEHDGYYGVPSTDSVVDMSWIDGLTLSSDGKAIEPRDYQLEAVHHALSKKRALLISPTASGKSLIIYLIIRWFLERYENKVLIVVPTTSLVNQMYTDFGDYSQYDDTFDHESTIHRIYSGRPKFAENERIIVSTWQSIYKLGPDWFSQFGAVIGDEAHNFKAKSLISILSKMRDAEYRFGTTGTLDGTQTHKLVLEGHFGPARYVTTTKTLMDSGALSELEISMILLKYPDEIRKVWGKKKYQEEMDYIVSYEKRNSFITNLALDQDGNTLVLFQYVEKHGKPLYDMIKKKAHARRQIFYVSGETGADVREDIRKITETQKNAIIVASLGTFSTGVNIRNLHNVIFASPSKSQIKVLQSIGRGLRKSDNGQATKLYDLADDLHWKSRKNYTLLHAAERMKIYGKEKFKYKIYEVDI